MHSPSVGENVSGLSYEEAVAKSWRSKSVGFLGRVAGMGLLAGAGYVIRRFGMDPAEFIAAAAPGVAVGLGIGVNIGLERGFARECLEYDPETPVDVQSRRAGRVVTTVGVLFAESGSLIVGASMAMAQVEGSFLGRLAAAGLGATGAILAVGGETLTEVTIGDTGRSLDATMLVHRKLFGEDGERL